MRRRRGCGRANDGREKSAKSGIGCAAPLTDAIRHGPFSEEETSALVKRRTELIEEGMADKAIARRISAEWGTRDSVSLYRRLRKLLQRGLIDANPNRIARRENGVYASAADDELLAAAEEIVQKEGITCRLGLKKKDYTLFERLKERGLLGRLSFGIKRRIGFQAKSDDEITAMAMELVRSGVGSRSKLNDIDSSLYNEVRKRGLFGSLGLGLSHRWAKIDDAGLVAYAKEYCAGNGITARYELQKAEPRLYFTLWKRNLLDAVGVSTDKKRAKFRRWRDKSDDELLEHAKRIMSEKSVRTRTEFRKADQGLAHAIADRDLMGKLEFKEGYLGDKRRPKIWEGVDDGELAAMAWKIIANNGFRSRTEFFKAYRGLYRVLRRRGLVDALFSDIETSRHSEAVEGVLEALESFGDER